MRDWDGIQDNKSDILNEEDALSTVENCSYFISGELGRRLGLGAQIVNAGLNCAELGSLVIFIKSNGNIESESQ